MGDVKYETIICIANAGFSGEVMDAARKEGATGGTILHARGTARKKAEEEFKITVNPEKDFILIVVRADLKDNIMKSIYEHAGLNTDANCVAFSLPVTKALGIK
ncbi:MAG: P-II family nitrogen regulator [Lachnospiraceae bacterium]|nr:P-II family nitrogen regulator [Lachnospiraceae bacterium]